MTDTKTTLQIVIDQTPKLMRRSKLPIVKAKVGPKIMTLVADSKIFDQIPVKKEVKAVAYFLMPAARFVSCQELKGAINFQQVRINPERKTKDLLKEIQKSYEYRKEEVLAGKLEETTGWTEDAITKSSASLKQLTTSLPCNLKGGLKRKQGSTTFRM